MARATTTLMDATATGAGAEQSVRCPRRTVQPVNLLTTILKQLTAVIKTAAT